MTSIRRSLKINESYLRNLVHVIGDISQSDTD